MSNLKFVDQKINDYAENILTRGDVNDTSALGELKFYIAIRNVVRTETQEVTEYEKASIENQGLFDAFADTLKEIDLIQDKNELIERLKNKVS